MNPEIFPPHILHGYKFQYKVVVVMFYMVYLTPYIVLEGRHERLDVPSWMPVTSIDKQLS
jgi:hypothetical protein